ncbi:MAG: iron-sulfur cluster assembly scaffold protein [Deltaproteobacteria bacterium]|nr:iron-sulfur cluster assembly scaffold protein [Deltaproteobacteria bacterium]
MTDNLGLIPETLACRHRRAPDSYSEQFMSHVMTPRNVGILPHPDGFGAPEDGCGDSMEISLVIKDDVITDIAFMTDGCAYTIACGSAVTELASGMQWQQALRINSGDISRELGGLSNDYLHCAELAAATLHLALKDYLESKRAPWKNQYRKR